jgi:hypothetical protein
MNGMRLVPLDSQWIVCGNTLDAVSMLVSLLDIEARSIRRLLGAMIVHGVA